MQNIQQEGSMAAPLHQNREDPVIPMAEAPPKQVATAMERLSRAARLFADIRIGADRLLEVLFLAAESPQESNKTVQLILKEEGAMLQHFQDLRSLGKHLEESGVLNGSVALRGNSWGLHMPLVCPDGAVVAYAWKRQLAGQAGASAVDRTRLALKAFTDQKRRFFPHLEDDVFTQHNDGEFVVSKKPRSSHLLLPEQKNDVMEGRTLPGIINIIQGVAPDVRVYTYQRLNWLKRASLLPSSSIDHLVGASNENAIQSASNSRSGLENAASITGQTAVIELLSPSLFRAVVSLHPAGSMTPDAVAFFSPEEGGSYVHARGLSVFHVFRHVTEHADKALQYFENIDLDTSLLLLLRWICSYQTLFSQVCSKCKRLLVMDESLGLILPPVHRTYHQTSASKSYPNQLTSSDNDQGCDFIFAYHIGCSVDDS